MQHSFAEGMNGLDLEAAGRFQRRGEQPAGAHQLMRFSLSPFELCNPLGEPGIIKPYPFAKRLENAVGHLRRGSLGVGQAQNCRGSCAA